MPEAGAAERFQESGDPDDFRALVEEHQGRVLRVVAGVLGPWSDLEAEEVAQEVFLRVLDRIGQWRGEAAFGAWLHRVALRTALNHRQRARLRLPHLGEEAFAAQPLDDDPARSAHALPRTTTELFPPKASDSIVTSISRVEEVSRRGGRAVFGRLPPPERRERVLRPVDMPEA